MCRLGTAGGAPCEYAVGRQQAFCALTSCGATESICLLVFKLCSVFFRSFFSSSFSFNRRVLSVHWIQDQMGAWWVGVIPRTRTRRVCSGLPGEASPWPVRTVRNSLKQVRLPSFCPSPGVTAECQWPHQSTSCFVFSTETLNELERIILIGFSFPLSLFPLFSILVIFAILPSLNSSLKVRVNDDCGIY